MSNQLLSIPELIPGALLDLRYASTNNIAGRVIAAQLPLLRADALAALQSAERAFSKKGYKLVVWDAYRAPQTQAALQEVVNDERYVRSDSNHPKGLAVDITLANAEGKYLDMGTDFDDFSPRAHVDATEINQIQRQNRSVLIEVMRQYGFSVWRYEWWHFDFKAE